MFGNSSRPKWWLLYLLVPVVIGLFVMEGKSHLSNTGHSVDEIAIVVVACALVAIWLRFNEAGVRREQWTEYTRTTYTSAGRIITIRRIDGETTHGAVAERAEANEEASDMATAGATDIPPAAMQGETVVEALGSIGWSQTRSSAELKAGLPKVAKLAE